LQPPAKPKGVDEIMKDRRERVVQVCDRIGQVTSMAKEASIDG